MLITTNDIRLKTLAEVIELDCSNLSLVFLYNYLTNSKTKGSTVAW